MFTVTIKTTNAAFQEGNAPAEIARILAGIARRLLADSTMRENCAVLDENGNGVGRWSYIEETA